MQKKPSLSFENTLIAFSSRSDKELRKMHFLFASMRRESITKIGSFFVKIALKIKLPVKSLIKNYLFNHFCGGENLEECKTTMRKLSTHSVYTILDYAVEGENNEKSYDATVEKVIETIRLDAEKSEIAFSVFKISGLASSSLLEKVQKGQPLSLQEKKEFIRVKHRIRRLCETAYKMNVKLMVDAEESWIQGTIDFLVYEMMQEFNKEKAVIYNTFQMYRRDMLYNLEEALKHAKQNNYHLGVKLVRGAYMEKERKKASETGYPSPIFASKKETDEAFNTALKFCMDNSIRISICCGSHNEYSNYYLADLIRENSKSKDDSGIWFAQLLGMSDHISYNLAAEGYNVAKYVPFGPVESVIPYLMRRSEENKAVTGKNSRELEMVEKEMKRRGLRK